MCCETSTTSTPTTRRPTSSPTDEDRRRRKRDSNDEDEEDCHAGRISIEFATDVDPAGALDVFASVFPIEGSQFTLELGPPTSEPTTEEPTTEEPTEPTAEPT